MVTICNGGTNKVVILQIIFFPNTLSIFVICQILKSNKDVLLILNLLVNANRISSWNQIMAYSFIYF